MTQHVTAGFDIFFEYEDDEFLREFTKEVYTLLKKHIKCNGFTICGTTSIIHVENHRFYVVLENKDVVIGHNFMQYYHYSRFNFGNPEVFNLVVNRILKHLK